MPAFTAGFNRRRSAVIPPPLPPICSKAIPDMKAKRCAAGAALACALAASASHASISLSTTRLIFDGNNKETSVVVTNDGADALIQAWLDPLEDNANGHLPFAITPPLAKLAPIVWRWRSTAIWSAVETSISTRMATTPSCGRA
ncbi:fimbria/pilus periplasmic chaperone [Ralstonia mannitolilytica]|uniref:fimbria/pilus periplasmic chaperone n=1 Tax=Ralstonia mannitolilytica TaxID=105219 RepID=UPI00215D6D82|nr:fimbria/pilus periplasmic chaperone [Ralstonia mannitolilytica]